MSIKGEKHFSSASSQITISTKIPGLLVSPRDLGPHQLDRPALHGLWQCGSGEYFLSESLIKVANMRMVEKYTLPTSDAICLSFPSVQAVTITWLQSLLQQVIEDMKKGFRATLEIEDRIQDSLVFYAWEGPV